MGANSHRTEFRKKLFIYTFLGFVIFIFLLVVYMLLPFWQALVLALISALVFFPLRKKLKKILFSDFAAALVTLIVILAIVVIPLTVLFVVLGQEIVKLANTINQYVQSGNLELLIEEIKQRFYVYLYKYQIQYPFLENLLNEEHIKKLINDLTQWLSQYFTKFTKEFLFWAANTVFQLFVYVLTLFFALYQGDKAVYHLKRIIPLEEHDKEEIFRTINDTVTAVIHGTVGTAIIQSIIAFFLYMYYGLPYPLLWAVVTAFFAFIPPFGTGYVWFPVTLYELLLGDFQKGLVGLAVGLFVISSIDNFVRPLIMQEKIELPYVFLFFAVVGGLLSFGFTGIFLGPTIFALFITLIKLYEQKFAAPSPSIKEKQTELEIEKD